jgi:hypothetical protein
VISVWTTGAIIPSLDVRAVGVSDNGFEFPLKTCPQTSDQSLAAICMTHTTSAFIQVIGICVKSLLGFDDNFSAFAITLTADWLTIDMPLDDVFVVAVIVRHFQLIRTSCATATDLRQNVW